MDEYANGPVYGETNKSALYVAIGVLCFLAVWTLYCVIIAIIYGFGGTWAHFGMAFLMICTNLHLLFSIALYKRSDQEQSLFMANCVVCVIIIIITGLCLNFYVWEIVASAVDPVVCPTCPYIPSCNDTYYYSPSLGECVFCNISSNYF